MFRTFVCVAASLLLVGSLYGDDKEKSAPSEKKPEAQADTVKKESTETKTETATPQRGRSRRSRSATEGHRGRVTKASIDNGVLKLSLDGKEYEFAVTEKTHAMLRTVDKDGKDTVVGLQLSNADKRQRARATAGKKRTRPTTKPKNT